ncbi:MAG TPA: asparagine synthase-related protein, partial [Solirubrobacteraceae bacterium]|nr:asparagine synthase-related protein [Solirubrobacteraceae bacterium]
MDTLSAARPTPLEIATGLVLGTAPGARLRAVARDPLEALQDALLPSLRRPPCLVLFSGGRDSSVVLAVAARAARSEGLPPPVAFTLRYAAAPETDETEWQERVVAHLGLRDWSRVDAAAELDLLGPGNAKTVRLHGVRYPANTAGLRVACAAARDGSVLDGSGGDELFGGWRAGPAADVLARRVAPRPRDVLRIGLALAPPRVRAARDGRA